MQEILQNLKIYLLNQLSTYGLDIAQKFVIAIIVFVILSFIIKKILGYIKLRIEEHHIGSQKDVEKVSRLITSILSILFLIFNFLIFLQILGLKVTILMGGIGLGFAFSLENIIANMIAGVMIVSNKKIVVGEIITIEGKFNITGVIENITLRYTVVKGFDRRRTIIPNIELIKVPIKTLKSEKFVRGEIAIHTSRHVNIQQIKDLLTSTINSHEEIIQQQFTNTIISSFDEKGIVFKSFFLVDPKVSSTGFKTKTVLNKMFLDIFAKYGIQIPYFHITLDIEN